MGRRSGLVPPARGGVKLGAKSGARLFASTGHRWKEGQAVLLESVGTMFSSYYGRPVRWDELSPDFFAMLGPERLREFSQSELGSKMLRIFFRSKMEANVARYLEALRTSRIYLEGRSVANWLYEPCRFGFPNPRGVREYVPDFLVLYNGRPFEFVEVKGYMDKASRTKLNRFAKNFPDLHTNHFRLIDESNYKAIARKLGPSIPGWE